MCPAKCLYYGALRRAKKHNLPFDLTEEDIVVPEHCPVLGIPLKPGRGTAKPNSPSLDRVIPKRGYTKDNCIVVSFRANTIKSNATVIELLRVATFYGNLIDQENPAN